MVAGAEAKANLLQTVELLGEEITNDLLDYQAVVQYSRWCSTQYSTVQYNWCGDCFEVCAVELG